MKLFRSPKGKIVRRLGVNIFDTAKYDKVLERRPVPPGQHGFKSKRIKKSEYGRQLLEKQKLKFAYGLTEKQFHNLFIKASKMRGEPGVNLMKMLEKRIDSVVFRAGLAASRPQARQMVNHGHFLLNGKKANIPSIILKEGDKITIKNKKSSTNLASACFEASAGRSKMPWLEVNEQHKETILIRDPKRDEIPVIIQEQLIVELYSR